MDRTELLRRLQESQIPEGAYDLSGGLPCESYTLDCASGKWQVYYSERGIKTGLREFDDESEACEHLFKTIIREVRPRP